MNHNFRRVFKKIAPDWDFDLHIHSNWSQDILDGPAMIDYIPLAERYKIHIGFADHYEIAYYETQNMKFGKWRLNPDTIDSYLNEIDDLKEQFSFISSGLEISYYPSKKKKLKDFIDDYGDQFDLLIGSVHEIDEFKPITVQSDLNWLINKYKSFENVINKYFSIQEDMVKSEIFDAIAHPNVIFRFTTKKEMSEQLKILNNMHLIELGKLCEKHQIHMEINSGGIFYPRGEPSPSLDHLHHLLSQGVQFIIGSDSHSLKSFKDSITLIRKINNIVRNDWEFIKKF